MAKPHIYTKEQEQFLKENIVNTPHKELAAMFNSEFGTNFNSDRIKAKTLRLGLKNGLDGRFQKGRESHNKGKRFPGQINSGCFKKGNKPHNTLAVGTELIKDDGYLWRKISQPNEWKQVHRLLWEEVNGPQPKGTKLIFVDGDRTNIVLDNLELVSDSELLLMNRNGLISDDAELTKTGVLVARVLDKTYRAKRNIKEE